jgi:hypothetical protein
MSDESTGFTDEQLALMHSLHETVHEARYSDALLALEVVLLELLCAGAPSKGEALAVANVIGSRLTANIDMQFDEISDPVGKVTLQ